MQAQLVFYERTFGLARRHLNSEENGAYGELETGSTVLAFASPELVARHLPIDYAPHDPAQPPAATEVTLEVEDVDRTVERAIAHGATLVASPEDKAWGQRVAFIRDPEGVLVGLTSPPQGSA